MVWSGLVFVVWDFSVRDSLAVDMASTAPVFFGAAHFAWISVIVGESGSVWIVAACIRALAQAERKVSRR